MHSTDVQFVFEFCYRESDACTGVNVDTLGASAVSHTAVVPNSGSTFYVLDRALCDSVQPSGPPSPPSTPPSPPLPSSPVFGLEDAHCYDSYPGRLAFGFELFTYHEMKRVSEYCLADPTCTGVNELATGKYTAVRHTTTVSFEGVRFYHRTRCSPPSAPPPNHPRAPPAGPSAPPSPPASVPSKKPPVAPGAVPPPAPPGHPPMSPPPPPPPPPSPPPHTDSPNTPPPGHPPLPPHSPSPPAPPPSPAPPPALPNVTQCILPRSSVPLPRSTESKPFSATQEKHYLIEERIVGGTTLDYPRELPFLVSLQNVAGHHFCGDFLVF